MSKRNNTIYLVTNTLVGEDVGDGNSGDNDNGDNPPTASAPNFPGNLRQQVYEPTTAEIFWEWPRLISLGLKCNTMDLPNPDQRH
jgi:hypothetical protein